MSTIVRAAKDGDFQSILSLVNELGYPVSDSANQKSIWDQIIHGPSSGLIVAESSGEITGYIAYSFKPQLRLAGIALEIDEMSVGVNSRGTGVGTLLLNHLKKIAVDKNATRILLSTNRNRESYKRGIYSKNGFLEKNSALMLLEL